MKVSRRTDSGSSNCASWQTPVLARQRIKGLAARPSTKGNDFVFASPTLSWLIDCAAEIESADRLLVELGSRLVAEGLPIAGGALSVEVAHPLIARRAWLWRADRGEVIEALGFAPFGVLAGAGEAGNQDERRWLANLAAGPAEEFTLGANPKAPWLAWVGPGAFAPAHRDALRLAARCAAAPLAALSARATLAA